MKLIKVVWEDHCDASDGWVDKAELDKEMKPAIINSIGYLVNEDDKIVQIVGDYADGHFRRAINILKSCIIEREEIGN
jgi:hypothetical protein